MNDRLYIISNMLAHMIQELEIVRGMEDKVIPQTDPRFERLKHLNNAIALLKTALRTIREARCNEKTD
jgi:hypothetical protein